MIRQFSSAVCITALLVLGGCGNSESTSAASDGNDTSAATATDTQGKDIYGQYCFSCHGPGLNGAPKLGDTEAWAPRIAKGNDLMLQTTIAGITPAMPPRGLCMGCSDEELLATIIYMSGQ
ncbi:MAG: c-type cytochrome [Pseudomonadota bacterium]